MSAPPVMLLTLTCNQGFDLLMAVEGWRQDRCMLEIVRRLNCPDTWLRLRADIAVAESLKQRIMESAAQAKRCVLVPPHAAKETQCVSAQRCYLRSVALSA